MKIYCSRNKTDLDILKSIVGKDLWIKVIWLPTSTYWAYSDYLAITQILDNGDTIKYKGKALDNWGYASLSEFEIVKPIDIFTEEELNHLSKDEISVTYRD